MFIDPSEIDSVEDIGDLDKKNKVRLVKTVGGLHLAVGKDKDSKDDKILAYSSHPAIVKHQLRKRFPMRFAESMAKSEGAPAEVARSYSHNLPAQLRDGGYDIFSLRKGMETTFVVTHDNMEILKAEAEYADVEDVSFKNVLLKGNFAKYSEFSQNDGNEALIESISEHLKGENDHDS